MNAVRLWWDWGSDKQLAKKHKLRIKNCQNATKIKQHLLITQRFPVNGVAINDTRIPNRKTFANTDTHYAKAKAYHEAVQAYNKAIESQKLSATKLSETGFSYVNVNGKAVPSGIS